MHIKPERPTLFEKRMRQQILISGRLSIHALVNRRSRISRKNFGDLFLVPFLVPFSISRNSTWMTYKTWWELRHDICSWGSSSAAYLREEGGVRTKEEFAFHAILFSLFLFEKRSYSSFVFQQRARELVEIVVYIL